MGFQDAGNHNLKMRIQEAGRVTDNFYVVGSPTVPVYLLDGPEPVLFDGGLTAISKTYMISMDLCLRCSQPPKKRPPYVT